MDTISTTVWQRKGSSIIFDKNSLSQCISAEAVISLRVALSWLKGLPDTPPVAGRTILVPGLDTIIETMKPQEAEDFLRGRVRPLLRLLQEKWPECGIVFGFSSHKNSFEEKAMDEEVVFHRRDRKTVRLTEGLWDGSATLHMQRIIFEGDQPGGEVTIGYYVKHIS